MSWSDTSNRDEIADDESCRWEGCQSRSRWEVESTVFSPVENDPVQARMDQAVAESTGQPYSPPFGDVSCVDYVCGRHLPAYLFEFISGYATIHRLGA